MRTLRGTSKMVTTIMAAAALLLAGCGGAEEDPGQADGTGDATDGGGAAVTVEVADSEFGEILADSDGLTLYVFDNDPDGASACTDDCLATWPPLLASDVTAGDGVTGELATFTREDGDEQVMVNDRPLYYFASDQAAGDVNGQAVGDVWWVVGPDGSKITATAGGDGATATPTEAMTTPAETTEPTEAMGDATLSVASTDLGDVLVNADGMTVYVFDNDDTDTSNCTGDCLSNWPPVTVDGEATGSADVSATVGTFERDDGTTQVTLDGRPLYTFAGDQATGDVNGHAVGDVWWAVTADGAVAGEAATSSGGYGDPNY